MRHFRLQRRVDAEDSFVFITRSSSKASSPRQCPSQHYPRHVFSFRVAGRSIWNGAAAPSTGLRPSCIANPSGAVWHLEQWQVTRLRGSRDPCLPVNGVPNQRYVAASLAERERSCRCLYSAIKVSTTSTVPPKQHVTQQTLLSQGRAVFDPAATRGRKVAGTPGKGKERVSPRKWHLGVSAVSAVWRGLGQKL